MKQNNEQKKAAGWAALEFIKNSITIADSVTIGIGTGSTVMYFIDAIETIKDQIYGVVSSSEASTKKLRKLGINILDLNELDHLDVYVDGADEINKDMQMIKGGGAALTREKIIAYFADTFICIADSSKQVDILGNHPLPVEVIQMAKNVISRQLIKLGGIPRFRQGVITDNGNIILDVYGMKIFNPTALENNINALPGVVTAGIFANRSADILLLGTEEGVKIIKK